MLNLKNKSDVRKAVESFYRSKNGITKHDFPLIYEVLMMKYSNYIINIKQIFRFKEMPDFLYFDIEIRSNIWQIFVVDVSDKKPKKPFILSWKDSKRFLDKYYR